MRILHICSYYIGNKLYMNLIKQLSFKGIMQEVFIPIKNSEHIGKNQLSSDFNTVNYYYKNILKKHDKVFYFNKIYKQMKEIEKSILVNKSIDFIHAHTVFSDGGTAYKIHRKYGIDYIVTVRNTDINTFYRYGIHLRPFMYKVLLNASAIIFISHAYKEQMLSLLPSGMLRQIKEKSYVIPNGIDDYWHENIITKKSDLGSKEVNLLFMGLIDENKNLGTVITACNKLREEGYSVLLNVIGNGPLEDKHKQMCKNLGMDKEVVFHGYLSNKEIISAIMDTSDVFILPSFKETFGLVYIESMSRGLPVIYSQRQGIDGFFEEGEVGYSIDPYNVKMICNTIKKILNNYEQISNNCFIRSKEFKWELITEKIRNLYWKDNSIER
ncbi:glycosyltransferase [Virgibacillus oceani]|uniref:Glycosyl transferase family 1 n=1 Tax=Virgibacillus oceani TaxID=1479511 RepID=A0A917M2L1_9BACI|nr:glycosyltransferase [Virgibacillus oceani]GGG73255.1 hypothetical protein GCM10011398_17080 [Virgibacillus oceani]